MNIKNAAFSLLTVMGMGVSAMAFGQSAKLDAGALRDLDSLASKMGLTKTEMKMPAASSYGFLTPGMADLIVEQSYDSGSTHIMRQTGYKDMNGDKMISRLETTGSIFNMKTDSANIKVAYWNKPGVMQVDGSKIARTNKEAQIIGRVDSREVRDVETGITGPDGHTCPVAQGILVGRTELQTQHLLDQMIEGFKADPSLLQDVLKRSLRQEQTLNKN